MRKAVGAEGLAVLDASWAYTTAEAEIDFGLRETHQSTVLGKLLAEVFYGQPSSCRYFYGDSTRGRQGLVEAQHYPDDFDGIVAVAPAGTQYTRLGAIHLIWVALANVAEDGTNVLDADKLPMLHDVVVSACDANDHLVDGLIEDPRTCNFDPAILLCDGTNAPECLTSEEVGVVRTIYTTPHASLGAELMPGGPMRGSELNWINNHSLAGQGESILKSPSVYYSFGESFLRYLVFDETLDRTTRHSLTSASTQTLLASTRQTAYSLTASPISLAFATREAS